MKSLFSILLFAISPISFASPSGEISAPYETICTNGNFHYDIVPDRNSGSDKATVCFSESGSANPIPCSIKTTSKCVMAGVGMLKTITCPDSGVPGDLTRSHVFVVDFQNSVWSESNVNQDGSRTPTIDHSQDGCRAPIDRAQVCGTRRSRNNGKVVELVDLDAKVTMTLATPAHNAFLKEVDWFLGVHPEYRPGPNGLVPKSFDGSQDGAYYQVRVSVDSSGNPLSVMSASYRSDPCDN